MRKVTLGASLMVATLWAGAVAACDYCSPTVTFTPLRAECFEVQFDRLVAEVEASAAGFVIVDLEDCMVDRNGQVVLRGVQQGLSRPADSDLSTAERTVVMDQNNLICTRKLIDEHRAELSPEIIFQMKLVCQ
jgi:hypothetical protein